MWITAPKIKNGEQPTPEQQIRVQIIQLCDQERAVSSSSKHPHHKQQTQDKTLATQEDT